MDLQLDYEYMRRLSADIRIETIKALAEAGFGHIGGSMSIADVLAVLYGGVMRIQPDDPNWENRDWLILSKGHCGPALYAVLALKGYFPTAVLKTINQPGTSLPSHCDRQKTPGVDMTTGSLGQGMSSAVGIALGNKLKGKDNYIYCILGDGELQEGQIWEGAEFAVHQDLDHFIVFIDDNKKQLDGPTQEICKANNTQAKFEAFGFHTQKIKGYDVEEICSAIDEAKSKTGSPSAIILDTYKGLGCDFAEKAVFNHYMVVNWDIANSAIAEIEMRLKTGNYPRGDVKWE